LLDTNACIAHLRGIGRVTERLRALAPPDVAVCSVVRSELMFGAARSRDPARERAVVEAFLTPFRSLPFDDMAADDYAEIRAVLESQGMRIGAYDTQIAAIARCRGLTLVTHNTGEFARVPGLQWEDWEGS
jgi:tRNA(fMet)-specific endonuclease VapC